MVSSFQLVQNTLQCKERVEWFFLKCHLNNISRCFSERSKVIFDKMGFIAFVDLRRSSTPCNSFREPTFLEILDDLVDCGFRTIYLSIICLSDIPASRAPTILPRSNSDSSYHLSVILKVFKKN